MTETFNCASCSAPLEFEGKTTQKCRYCGSTVITPHDLFHSAGGFPDLSSLSGKALEIAEISELVHGGNKLEAIKLFRATFGVDLEEAKNAVERMELGESVDISGMHVSGSRRATPEDIEKVKKIGYTIGGSILGTVVLSMLIIGGVIVAVFYFTWSSIQRNIPNVANTSTTPKGPVVTTGTPNAFEILKIGGEGNGAGRFKDNRHVAVDGLGRIYSSDYSPHRIQVFDANGKFVNQWNPETGSNLYDLVADRDGNVYLANDKGIFKHEGETGKVIARSTNIYPRGIALTWDGKIIAATGKSIAVLNNSLKLVNEFKDAAEISNSTFGFEKLAADGSGAIYALDSHNDEVCKFSPEGKFLNRFKTEANAPHALAVDPEGRLFVSDTSMIYMVDSNGKTEGSFFASQAFGITFDEAGDLYIASRPYIIKRKVGF